MAYDSLLYSFPRIIFEQILRDRDNNYFHQYSSTQKTSRGGTKYGIPKLKTIFMEITEKAREETICLYFISGVFFFISILRFSFLVEGDEGLSWYDFVF